MAFNLLECILLTSITNVNEEIKMPKRKRENDQLPQSNVETRAKYKQRELDVPNREIVVFGSPATKPEDLQIVPVGQTSTTGETQSKALVANLERRFTVTEVERDDSQAMVPYVAPKEENVAPKEEKPSLFQRIKQGIVNFVTNETTQSVSLSTASATARTGVLLAAAGTLNPAAAIGAATLGVGSVVAQNAYPRARDAASNTFTAAYNAMPSFKRKRGNDEAPAQPEVKKPRQG